MNIKAIAFYLPQFHPIPENDEWWGKGFTEWTNVTKSKALYPGHNQPRQPSDLGFYDLRTPETRSAQAELARSYGIHGFCYYYYWFGGKKLLQQPIEAVVASGDPDFPFCLCWANENWTRRWDGQENEILMDQSEAGGDPKQFIEDVLPIMKDKRYIKINGKPILLIYRPELIANILEVTTHWRKRALEAGVGEIFLVKCEHGFSRDVVAPKLQGFDASYEFPPHRVSFTPTLPGDVSSTQPDLSVCAYEVVATESLQRQWPDYKLFRGAMLEWDNTARKGTKGVVFHGFTPEIYEWWLTELCIQTIENHPQDERFIFINAWNEWAEGTYLEPDTKYGHRNLQATARALKTSERYATLSALNSKGDGTDQFFKSQYQVMKGLTEAHRRATSRLRYAEQNNSGLSRENSRLSQENSGLLQHFQALDQKASYLEESNRILTDRVMILDQEHKRISYKIIRRIIANFKQLPGGSKLVGTVGI